MTLSDRALSWIVTGPIGRGAAFSIELAAAVAELLRARLRRRSRGQSSSAA